MDLHDRQNIKRVLRNIAAQWCCPVWVVKLTIQQKIDMSWEKAISDPYAKALWDRYFPNGKPSTEEYILQLGHAHEQGESIPFLLSE